jgi:hypothetical protein
MLATASTKENADPKLVHQDYFNGAIGSQQSALCFFSVNPKVQRRNPMATILPVVDLLSTSRAEHTLDISSIGIPDPL